MASSWITVTSTAGEPANFQGLNQSELYLVCIATWNPQYLGFAEGICAEKGSGEVRSQLAGIQEELRQQICCSDLRPWCSVILCGLVCTGTQCMILTFWLCHNYLIDSRENII